ncbi:MAG: hypothetical protein GY740_07230 [Gammaproteobacteria bacterium]|nr:hypothetical protein [Gammaproteobacteria bacterium]
MFQPPKMFEHHYSAGAQLLSDTLVKVKMCVDKLEEIPDNNFVAIVVGSSVVVEFVHLLQVTGNLFPRPFTFMHEMHADNDRQSTMESFLSTGKGVIITSEQVLSFFADECLDLVITMVDCSHAQLQRILKPPCKITFLLKATGAPM